MCLKFIIHADFAAISSILFPGVYISISESTPKLGHTLAQWSGSIHPKIELAWKVAQAGLNKKKCQQMKLWNL